MPPSFATRRCPRKGFCFAAVDIRPAGRTLSNDHANPPVRRHFVGNPAGLCRRPAASGHDLTSAQATAKADSVFAGRLVSLQPVKDSAGQYKAKVLYLNRTPGDLGVPVATQNVPLRTEGVSSNLRVPVSLKVAAGESAPQEGRSYLFYVKDEGRSGKGYQVVKLTSVGSTSRRPEVFLRVPCADHRGQVRARNGVPRDAARPLLAGHGTCFTAVMNVRQHGGGRGFSTLIAEALRRGPG